MKRLFCLLIALALTLACAALAEAAPQMAPPRPLETPLAAAAPETTAMPKATAMPRAAAMPETTLTAVPKAATMPETTLTAAPEATATPETSAAPEATPAPGDVFSLLPAQMPTVPPQPTRDPGRLTGVKIGIDPGHQAQGNSAQEAVAPGSSETKARVSSGTSGRFTGVPEYEVNLDVSLQLRDALEALGCEVYMTRETNDVDISNQERAVMMNELGVDLVLRIHCNGSTNKSAQGIGLYIRKTGTNADECMRAAEALLPAMIEATGAESDGIFRRDTYTGLNWSEVPSILVEMGFMTNEEEDYKLNDPAYQQLLVQGMVEGVCAYMGR